MAVKTSETTDDISVSVDGDLDLSTIASFQSAVQQALEQRDDRSLIIDLRRTDYIDSAGLEQLLVANRKLMAQGSRLSVSVRPGSQPKSVLTVTGFDSVMEVSSDPNVK